MICEIRDYYALKQILMSALWTIVVRGEPWAETSWFIIRLVRAFPSLIVTVEIFSPENYQNENNKNKKTKKEREDVN